MALHVEKREARVENKAVQVCIFLKLHEKLYFLIPKHHFAVKQN